MKIFLKYLNYPFDTLEVVKVDRKIGSPRVCYICTRANKIPIIINYILNICFHFQLYIQESVRMQALVQSQATLRPALGSGHDHPSTLVLPWKPVPARLTGLGWEEEEGRGDHENSETAVLLHEKEYATTAISVLYASEYVNGTYLRFFKHASHYAVKFI